MRIVLGDGPDFVVQSLTRLFEQHGHAVVAATTDPAELVRLVDEHRPDVCVLEVASPRSERITAAMQAVRSCARRTDVVVLTGAPASQLGLEALAEGATAIVSKASVGGDLVAQVERRLAAAHPVVRRAARNGGHLTPRELEVLGCLADGDSTVRIGNRLGMSAATVRSHVQSVLWKLGVHNRSGAVAVAVQTGLIPQLGP
ncbi:MAG TPA: response regulator transcription factor [Acidimicrobiales bacterium]|jgi:two-component system nitrate/nitrite response regulator NarL|nr:response regulator transcription factor [Acidimicrobiales bacterium]